MSKEQQESLCNTCKKKELFPDCDFGHVAFDGDSVTECEGYEKEDGKK